MAGLSPFALSALGIEQAPDRRRDRNDGNLALALVLADPIPTLTTARLPRISRRVTSHHNSFQTICSPATDAPPAYPIAARQKPVSHRPTDGGLEPLPAYSCSVSAEAKVLLNVESNSPLHAVSDSDWREVYLVLRGTMISVHRVKDGGRGRLLRYYTLQHAEIGLATDASHTVWLSTSKLAQLIPASARRKAHQKDPRLFKLVQQHILRLRVETDQILFAHESEAEIHHLIDAIAAAIDLAPSIDERSATRQCTVPRRRRRPRPQLTADLNDPSLIAEQERIMRQMYPSLADQSHDQQRPELPRQTSADSNATTDAIQSSTREEDEIDLNEMREHFAHAPSDLLLQPSASLARPPLTVSRQTTATAFPGNPLDVTDPSDLTADGKWNPPHHRTPAQILRYTRRCAPVLLANAVRASDVLICDGRRMRVNWRMELLEDWELKPPGYKAHAFDRADRDQADRATTRVQRSPSCASASASSSSAAEADANTHTHTHTPHSSRSLLGGAHDDVITPVPSANGTLQLTKSVSSSTTAAALGKGGARVSSRDAAKAQEIDRAIAAGMHGLLYCF